MSDGKMQAVVVREYGGPEVLRLEQIDRPVPGAGEALVKIRYASVIPLDWKIRSGSAHNVFPKTFPYVPGFYASGVIEALGPGVTDFKVGDRVFGAFDGAYAEYGVAPAVRPDGAENPEGAVPAKALVKMPDGLSFEDAAAIRAGADAAWHALFAEGNLQAGQTVLIHAAAGGVGQFAVQLAKWKGARVIATCSAANADFVMSLGADEVIDYAKTAFAETVKDVDLVIDGVGGETQDRSWAVLKRGGVLVALTQPPSREQAEAHGVRATFNYGYPSYEQLLTIAQMIANETLKAKIDSVFPLGEADKAHAKSESGHGRGRILLRVGAEDERPS
ncbi:Quinone oxidoreductase Qor [Thermobacillus xylanilyticus]|uniref:Quinone oxidoreductase Qor n=1 Tax=Thermobacillus xylanilyticus TaxID=76633 RepID=A0ABN7RPE2_THEXY|nr:NADP-dependent oxidoreductase [Thermobacillus xylanilyticus]CAG5078824.1 Quinone oxidoreductase Qor [Thermobacillus xylanilyticus]